MASPKKKKIKTFVSYAHDDDEYVEPFISHLRQMLRPSKAYDFELWIDKTILPGENWLAQIHTALETCNLGLLLMSPAFLGSLFIQENEIPRFVGDDAKPVIPVMLRKVNLRLHDLKGLNESQIYRYRAGPRNLRSFAQCGSSQREEFIYDLHEQIEARLNKIT